MLKTKDSQATVFVYRIYGEKITPIVKNFHKIVKRKIHDGDILLIIDADGEILMRHYYDETKAKFHRSFGRIILPSRFCPITRYPVLYWRSSNIVSYKCIDYPIDDIVLCEINSMRFRVSKDFKFDQITFWKRRIEELSPKVGNIYFKLSDSEIDDNSLIYIRIDEVGDYWICENDYHSL